MREYPSLISRRGDIQVLPCASLRTGLTLRKNKEFSPGSKTKGQVLQDTLRTSRDEKRAEINRWPQLMLPNTLLLKSSPFIFEFIQARFGQCFPERAQKAVSPRWEAPSLELGTLTHPLLFPPPFSLCPGFPSLPLFSLIKSSPPYNFDDMVPLPGCPEGTGDQG